MTAPASGHTEERAFGWFAGEVGSWFGAAGMQSVVFSWLVVGELEASPEWVGIAQTSVLLPSLLLLLFGGAAADRVDPRGLLMALRGAAALPVVLLAAALSLGSASMAGVLIYGVCLGTVGGLAMPARDALLSRVAGSDLMRAVTGMTAAQFGSQSLGTLCAGAAGWTGLVPVLAAQAVLLLAGVYASFRIPAAAPLARESHPSALHELTEGLRVVLRSELLRAPALLAMSVGFFFVGPFLVTIPLLVRDVYAGGPAELSLVFMLFPLGTIAGSLVLRVVGLRRKGVGALASLVVGSAALASMGLDLPFFGLMAVTLVWGLAGSVFINASRALFQQAAPDAQRARALAVYQLGFTGGGPLGAMIAGFAGAELGFATTLFLFSGGMLVMVTVAGLFTGVARME